MKCYGRDGNKKMKKRDFEVIMNTATKGIYSDFTPMKVAKKVTSELVGKKKQIIFTLREKGKSGKNYGPYIGSIKDGRVVARIHKMSGGDLIDCIFNKITVNNFKVDVKDQPEIKITKFCFRMTTIIFFDFLEYKQKKYYKYAIYKEKDTVFVIELEISDDNKLQIKNIEIKDIKNSLIGSLISEKYTTLKFKLDFYKNNIINIEYKDNYKSVKIYLDDDDKIFYIIFKNNKYFVYLFNNVEIGIIKKDIDKNIYKIMVYEEYKLYLNLIALGLITLLNN